jgi:FixJ family two-component response regulator
MNRLEQEEAACACICIVDDDAAVRLALASLFDACGYVSRAFDSAEALLAWPCLGEFDFAVFDVKLPGIDGFALQERLAGLRAPLPLLFISGQADRETRVRAQRAGALDLLPKPVDPERLLDHVERALAGRGSAA